VNDWLNSHPIVGIIIIFLIFGYYLWYAFCSFRHGRAIRENINKMKREADRKIKSGEF
jgi:hypothetical protein